MAAMPSFAFGAGFQAKTPEEVARNRAVYEAMVARGGTAPSNLGQGLNRVGETIAALAARQQADQGDATGRERVAEVLSGFSDGADQTEILGALSDPWVAADPAGSAVAQTLLQRQFQQDDPAYNLDLDYKRAQLDALKTPKPLEAPQVETRFNPETGLDEKVQWNPATGAWDAFGGQKAPDDPLVSVDVNNGGADDEFYKAGAKARGEQFAAIETAGYQAQTKVGQITRLEGLLASAPQGMEGAWKQLAGQVGINSEGLDDIQAAQALINKMVPEQRTPGSGPMSDADLALFKESMPRIINQPGGNTLIIQTLKGIAVYEQQMGEIAGQVLNKEITPAEGRAKMAAVTNPLDLFKTASSGGGGDAVPQGIDPEDWAVMTPEQKALWN